MREYVGFHRTSTDGGVAFYYQRRWVPVYSDPSKMLSVMSLAFLLPDRDAAVVWRGPKKNGEIIYLRPFEVERDFSSSWLSARADELGHGH